jgi:hypothetical protein
MRLTHRQETPWRHETFAAAEMARSEMPLFRTRNATYICHDPFVIRRINAPHVLSL